MTATEIEDNGRADAADPDGWSSLVAAASPRRITVVLPAPQKYSAYVAEGDEGPDLVIERKVIAAVTELQQVVQGLTHDAPITRPELAALLRKLAVELGRSTGMNPDVQAEIEQTLTTFEQRA